MDYNEIISFDKFNFLKDSNFIKTHELCMLVSINKNLCNLEELEMIGFCLDSESEIECNLFRKKVFEVNNVKLYTLNQVLKGLLKCDTNILELFGHNDSIIFQNEHGKYLQKRLGLFLSKKSVMNSFGGYAWKLKGIVEDDLSKLNYYTQEKKEEVLLKNMNKYIDELNIKNNESYFNLHLNGEKMTADINLKNVSFKHLKKVINSMHNVLSEYRTIQCNKINGDIILKKSTLNNASILAEIYLIAIDIFKYNKINYKRDEEVISDILNRKYEVDELLIILNSLEEQMNLEKRISCLPNDIEIREIKKVQHYFRKIYSNQQLSCKYN